VEAASNDAADRIAEALEKMAKQKNLKALENRISPISDAIEVRFMKATGKLDPNGKFFTERLDEILRKDCRGSQTR